MRIYVAGKFEDRENVRRIQNALRELGHTITFDWTTDEFRNREATTKDILLCTEGAKSADVYVGLFEKSLPYKGALVEMGVCLGLGKECCIIGHAIDSCIFCFHSLVKRFGNKEEFLVYAKENY